MMFLWNISHRSNERSPINEGLKDIQEIVKSQYKYKYSININKMKGSFRIICLKNDESRKYRDERFKNSNIIVSQFDGRDKKASESLIPNLVHLSARLQDDSH